MQEYLKHEYQAENVIDFDTAIKMLIQSERFQARSSRLYGSYHGGSFSGGVSKEIFLNRMSPTLVEMSGGCLIIEPSSMFGELMPDETENKNIHIKFYAGSTAISTLWAVVKVITVLLLFFAVVIGLFHMNLLSVKMLNAALFAHLLAGVLFLVWAFLLLKCLTGARGVQYRLNAMENVLHTRFIPSHKSNRIF